MCNSGKGEVVAELYKVEFPRDIRMNRIYENKNIIEEFHKRSPEEATLPLVKHVFGEMQLPGPHADRPYLYCSLVSSLDGRIAYADDPVSTYIAKNNYLDKVGGIINFWSLMMQRTHADAVITAANTLISEPEGTLHICDSQLLEERRRVLKKKSKHPLNIVISRRGTNIPFEHKIFNSLLDEELHVLLVTSHQGQTELHSSPRQLHFIEIDNSNQKDRIGELKEAIEDDSTVNLPVLVLPGPKQDEMGIDTDLFMLILKQIGMERVFIESPSYMYHLIEKQILDEFFVDFSLVFAGGSIIAGKDFYFASTNHPHAELVSLAIHNQNFVYTRNRMVYGE